MLGRIGPIALISLLVGIVVAQDQCGVDVYCGEVCCSEANVQQGCCVTTSIPMSVDNVCCAREALNEARECGSTTCPTDLPEELVYDSAVTPAELRNQCCLYFREGCCSQSENNFLDLLFKLALGLGIGLGGLLVIILLLVVCCCCCICCD